METKNAKDPYDSNVEWADRVSGLFECKRSRKLDCNTSNDGPI